MEKHLVIKISGSTEEPKEITIHPGTSVGDVLDSLGLSRNMILTQDAAAGTPFGIEEVLYDRVENGSKLYCVPQMSVGK